MKRLFDLVLSGFGLLLLSPLFLVVALVIKLDSRGPVFFRQERVGRYGRPFLIFKFRTMTVAQRETLQITVAGDTRVTRIGSFLRRYKIDELPQLIDVVRGTMSLVGPRPEVPQYVAQYPVEQRERILSVRPGITDFASILFRNESDLLAGAEDPEQIYLNTVLPEKLRIAVNYVDHASLAGDLRVLGLTVNTVFVSENSRKALRNLMQHRNFWLGMERILTFASRYGTWVAVALDSLIVVAAWHITYLFRLGFERWEPGRPWYDNYVLVGVWLCYLVCLQLAGVRRSMWRFFSFEDFRRLMTACVSAGVLSAVCVLMAQLVGVARAVLVLHPIFALVGLVLVRSLYRMLYEHTTSVVSGQSSEHRYAVLIGAGQLAQRLVAGLHRRDGWFIVALLDEDSSLHGRWIGGVRVEGGFDRLRDPALIVKATHAIVALDSPTDQEAGAVALAKAAGLTILSVPRAHELDQMQPVEAAASR